MIFGPVLAYIPQFQMIKKNKSVGNFSLWVCAILIFGNILRIFFWYKLFREKYQNYHNRFGSHFKIALLIQSILMIICQVITLFFE